MTARPVRLLPQCDRCGRPTPREALVSDGLGDVCPACHIGGTKAAAS